MKTDIRSGSSSRKTPARMPARIASPSPDAKTEEVLSNGLPPFPNLSEAELRLDSLALIYPMTLYGITPNRISVTGLIPVGPVRT